MISVKPVEAHEFGLRRTADVNPEAAYRWGVLDLQQSCL